jgi:hypothetical protein
VAGLGVDSEEFRFPMMGALAFVLLKSQVKVLDEDDW